MDNPKIVITEVHGGEDKNDLLFCYFQETTTKNEFLFFKEDGTPIPTVPSPIKKHEDFSFCLCGEDGEMTDFEVTEFKISEKKLKASGHWSAPRRGKSADPDPETGTFQAPGGHPEELSAGASGSA